MRTTHKADPDGQEVDACARSTRLDSNPHLLQRPKEASSNFGGRRREKTRNEEAG